MSGKKLLSVYCCKYLFLFVLFSVIFVAVNKLERLGFSKNDVSRPIKIGFRIRW